MAGLGFEVSTQVLGGAALGWLYDRWQGTAPNGLLVGALVGVVVGLWGLVKGALKLNRELERRHPTTGRGRPLIEEEERDDWDDDGSDANEQAGG